jgi:hypothetical protein
LSLGYNPYFFDVNSYSVRLLGLFVRLCSLLFRIGSKCWVFFR